MEKYTNTFPIDGELVGQGLWLVHSSTTGRRDGASLPQWPEVSWAH